MKNYQLKLLTKSKQLLKNVSKQIDCPLKIQNNTRKLVKLLEKVQKLSISRYQTGLELAGVRFRV